MNLDTIESWLEIKKLFKKSFRSSLHFSIASVDPEGNPHITPIGSLILGETGKGIYFEEYTRKLPKHCKENSHICVLAVNSSKLFWLKSLIRGEFSDPPALRLYGTLGKKREATEVETRLWKKRVRAVSFTEGYKRMWANMNSVREISFTHAEPVKMGRITQSAFRKLEQRS